MARKAEKISQREYAKLLDVSNEAVSKAVREGRIRTGWDAKNKKIIVSKANVEWGYQHIKADVAEILEDKPKSSGNKFQLNAETPAYEADRIRKIFEAQVKGIELKRLNGELVNKDEVNKQLFALGQQLKSNIMGLPDKVIDNILATKTRGEAHLLLTNELHEALESVVKEFNKN